MKFALLVFSTVLAFSSHAKSESMTFQHQIKVKKVVMKELLPTNLSKLHRDFYFEDKVIAKK